MCAASGRVRSTRPGFRPRAAPGGPRTALLLRARADRSWRGRWRERMTDDEATNSMGSPTLSEQTLLISTRSVIERDGSTDRMLLVPCPREDRTIALEHCVGCASCTRMDASDDNVVRPSVTCSFEGPSLPEGAACRVLSRFSFCIRLDAVSQPSLPPPPAGLLAVVDERMH